MEFNQNVNDLSISFDDNASVGDSSNNSVNPSVGADDEVEADDQISVGVAGVNNLNSGNGKSPSVSSIPNPSETGNSVEPICDKIEERLAVGSVVCDLEQAYILYCEYGRYKGFGVRRGEQRYIGRSENLKWKEYVCCCAGLPDGKRSVDGIPSYKKLVRRTGCKARLRLGRRLGEPWRVTIFEKSHNHGLVLSNQTYMLRSSRNLSYANQAILGALNAAGIGVSGACGFMERECGGPQNLGFIRQDAYDHVKREKRLSKLENADATALMEYFINKSNKEPFFFWRCQLDDEGRLMNFFFRDSRCADDYCAFGDVLSVDTTYRTNMYKLICAPFVGINHHTFTVLFGVAFLSDETTRTFEWLFRVFLESMNGVEPKIVFTDQCKAMMNAIKSTFPSSNHRLCQWHINKNASAKFGKLRLNASFKKMWHKCMNEVESEDEFDKIWSAMIESNNLKDKTWFTNMYDMRHMWASVFTRGIFSAGLLATSRSEGTNRVLKNLQRGSKTLFEVVCNYDLVQDRWRHREAAEDALGIWMPGQLVSDNPLFTQAASVYTIKVYKLFEKEGIRAVGVAVSNHRRDLGEGNVELTVRGIYGGRTRKVIYNMNTNYVTCSCRKWESEGIFCRHILKVYYVVNVFAIPESQILKRWTKKAKEGCYTERIGPTIRSTLPYMLFVNTVMRHLYEMACSCMDNDEARSLIIDRLDSLRVDVCAKVGLPQAKPKRKSLRDLNTNDNDIVKEFLDPKPVVERGFSIARSRRHLDAFSKPGPSIKKKVQAKTSMPQVPPEFVGIVAQETVPATVNVEGSNERMLRDEAIYKNFSRP